MVTISASVVTSSSSKSTRAKRKQRPPPTRYRVQETNEDPLMLAVGYRRGPRLDADPVLVTKRWSATPSGQADGRWEWRATGVG